MREFWASYGNAVIGLIGVIVGSFITVSKDSWIAYRSRRQNGSYAAIRLINILEEYADHCCDVVADDGTSRGQPAGKTKDGEEYYKAQVAAPAPPDYPDDIEWQSLKPSIMHRILALPNLARSTNRQIAAAAEHSFMPGFEEVFEARQEGYARIGIETHEIIKQLRADFSVAAQGRAQLNTDWNPERYLREELLKLEAERDAREKRAEGAVL